MSGKQEVKLGELIQSHNSGIYVKKTEYGKGYPIVGVGDLFKIDTISNQDFPKAPIPPEEFEKYSLEVGDIIYAESSLVRGGIAKCVYVKNIQMPTAFAWHTRRLKTDSNRVLPAWLYFYLESPKARKQIEAVATQTALTGITTKDYFETIVHLPDMSTQSAQAGFLSAVDDKLGAIEAQLMRWREYKRGMMQALFSQTLRFKADEGSDFPDWEQKQIGDVLTIGSGKDYKSLGLGKVPVYGTGGLMTFVDEFLYDGESVGIGRKGTIDKPVFLTGKFWTVDTLFYTHSFEGVLPKFIFAIFQRINWQKYNEASGVPSLSKKTIEKIEISFPSLPEQQKIAESLTAIDTKIEALTQRLEATKEFKRGLLQKMFV